MNKDFRDMTDDELRAELKIWENNVNQAAGWASTHFAAKCLAAIVRIGNERGLKFENKFPIKQG